MPDPVVAPKPPTPVPQPQPVKAGPQLGDTVVVRFKVVGVSGEKELTRYKLESALGVAQTGTIVGTKSYLRDVHPSVVETK